MRQPVCVGCDGRELLTPNSVTAPLTELHLNAHKRSPKYLRSTRSFTGGCGVGASPGKQPRRGLQAEGRASQAQKSGQCGECRGLPPAGAVPALPRHQRSIRRDPEPWAMGSWAPNPAPAFVQKSHSGVHIQQKRCRPGNGSMDSTSTRSVPRGAQMSRFPARELLPPDNLGHCLKAKEAVQTGACNKNLRVEAASMKSSKGHESFFESVLVCSRSGCAPFICLGNYTKHRENRKAVAQTHCKHSPAAQLRANQQNLQSLKYVCEGAILSVT